MCFQSHPSYTSSHEMQSGGCSGVKHITTGVSGKLLFHWWIILVINRNMELTLCPVCWWRKDNDVGFSEGVFIESVKRCTQILKILVQCAMFLFLKNLYLNSYEHLWYFDPSKFLLVCIYQIHKDWWCTIGITMNNIVSMPKLSTPQSWLNPLQRQKKTTTLRSSWQMMT